MLFIIEIFNFIMSIEKDPEHVLIAAARESIFRHASAELDN